MLEIFKSILFGIVEGITEWLPISSTGHMILLDEFINLKVSDEFYTLFQVVIQLGAILAVVLMYFKTICPFGFGKDKQERKDTWNLWGKILVCECGTKFQRRKYHTRPDGSISYCYQCYKQITLDEKQSLK